MGNNISISTFQDQLTSSCLWSLRHDEIIDYYLKNQKVYKSFNLPLETITFDNISHLYTKTTQSNLNFKNNYFNNYNISNPEPEQLYIKLSQDYLNHMLNNETETNKFIQDVILHLQTYK